MKIALFGSKGYLGSQLSYYLSNHGWIVDGFDLPDCDVVDEAFWQGFSPEEYDKIVFFAGMTGTERSFVDASRFVEVNELGVLNLLRRVSSLGEHSPQIIFPSTRLVYKGSEAPLVENSQKEARTVYAATKIACEALFEAYGARYQIPSTIIRICVPYGNIISHDLSYGTIGFFLKQALSGLITLYGGGSQRRTFTHVSNICEVVDGLLRQGIVGTFNIGGSVLSLRAAAEIVGRKFGAVVVPVDWPKEALCLESGSTFFDSSKLSEFIDVKYIDFGAFWEGANEFK